MKQFCCTSGVNLEVLFFVSSSLTTPVTFVYAIPPVEMGFCLPDYLLFAEMLLQRPVGRQTLSLSDLNKLTEKELKYMQDMAAQRFDKIMRNLRSMPRAMLLTIR